MAQVKAKAKLDVAVLQVVTTFGSRFGNREGSRSFQAKIAIALKKSSNIVSNSINN
jgi:hypothetical protein